MPCQRKGPPCNIAQTLHTRSYVSETILLYIIDANIQNLETDFRDIKNWASYERNKTLKMNISMNFEPDQNRHLQFKDY